MLGSQLSPLNDSLLAHSHVTFAFTFSFDFCRLVLEILGKCEHNHLLPQTTLLTFDANANVTCEEGFSVQVRPGSARLMGICLGGGGLSALGVCLGGVSIQGGSAFRKGSALRRGLHPGGSASSGVCIQWGLHPVGSASG